MNEFDELQARLNADFDRLAAETARNFRLLGQSTNQRFYRAINKIGERK